MAGIADFALRHARQLQGLVEEVRGTAPGRLLIAGEESLAREIRRIVTAGGDGTVVDVVGEGALAAMDAAGAAAALTDAVLLVGVVESQAPSGGLERLLRAADRGDVPIACVWRIDSPSEHEPLPYVLATDVLQLPPGSPLVGDDVLERIGARAGARGFALAARLPALRPAVADALVRHYARLGGAVGAAVFVPGADMPALALNQLRMVARIAAAHGIELDNRRLVQMASVVGIGFGLRAVARQALSFVPGPGWAIKGAVAYGGTVAIGRAAIAHCRNDAATPSGGGSSV